jgi:hypothetical protein
MKYVGNRHGEMTQQHYLFLPSKIKDSKLAQQLI